MLTASKIGYSLSGNALKIIATITMLIDHIGVILLPQITLFRVIGRISFPIFAFMIAEGCAHTKNKLRYFLSVFLLGIGCQLVLYIAKGPEKLNVLISFSISMLGIYALQYMKNKVFCDKIHLTKKCFSVLVFVFAIIGIYYLNKFLRIDYGFFGCMLPLSVSIFRAPATNRFVFLKRLDNKFLHLTLLGICLVFMALKYRGVQIYALFSILLLLFYSGERGKFKMKYFFYLFYPIHLVILEGISYILLVINQQ